MNERNQLIDFFERFYELVARPQLHHTVADSEWTHFSGMLKAGRFEPDRIEFYLKMLEHEEKSKKEGGGLKAPTYLQFELPSKKGLKQFPSVPAYKPYA